MSPRSLGTRLPVLLPLLGITCVQEHGAMYRDITPQDAHDLLQAGQGYVYVDVRSVPEFVSGHAAPAKNVPLKQPDPAAGRLVDNPDFLKVVEANWAKDTPLILGCRSGGRSAKAAAILTQAGFTNVCNMHGGFEAAKDETGAVVQPGWSMLGFPINTDNGQGVGYESLSATSPAP